MSTLNHARGQIDTMLTQMRKERKPQVNVVSIDAMTNEGFARVTASVTHTSESRKDANVALEAIASRLGGKLRPVHGSFQIVASNKVSDTLTGIFTCNPETIAFEEGMNGYKAVAGNMFIDDEEQLWALRKTEAGNLLVKSRGKEDADIIAELMTSLSSVSVGSVGFEAVASVQREERARTELQGGDFVAFVHPQREEVVFGAVVASVCLEDGRETGELVVVASGEDTSVVVDCHMALAKFADVEYDDTGLVDENTVEANAHSIDEISAYYQRLFQRDPSYFEKFMERWMNHAFA